MATRNILDYQGNIIGSLTLPDSTSETQWAAALAPYALISPSYVAAQQLANAVSDRKAFCANLLAQFKQQNIAAGINAIQGLWMHQRMAAVSVTISGVSFTIDLINLADSGDVELGTIVLQAMTPDDMSQPYHWLNATRINWLVAQLKTYLGWS
jgi:hypothetical protein